MLRISLVIYGSDNLSSSLSLPVSSSSSLPLQLPYLCLCLCCFYFVLFFTVFTIVILSINDSCIIVLSRRKSIPVSNQGNNKGKEPNNSQIPLSPPPPLPPLHPRLSVLHLDSSPSSFPISRNQILSLPLPVRQCVYLVAAFQPHFQSHFATLSLPQPTWAHFFFLCTVSCYVIPPSVRTSGSTTEV